MTIDTKKLREICPIMTVQVWGSDECILRKALYYRDSDIEEVIQCVLALQAKIEGAFRQGVIEGETKQAKLEIQARERFMKDLREGKIKA